MFVCIGWGPGLVGDCLKGWIRVISQRCCLKAEVGVDLLYWWICQSLKGLFGDVTLHSLQKVAGAYSRFVGIFKLMKGSVDSSRCDGIWVLYFCLDNWRCYLCYSFWQKSQVRPCFFSKQLIMLKKDSKMLHWLLKLVWIELSSIKLLNRWLIWSCC